MQLSIIIVNYNVPYFLEQCLIAVQKAMLNIAAEVIVVDNHSTDNSMLYLPPKFPFVHFIKNKENIGFGKANNLAAEKARGAFLLFLNPDTLVPENAFADCLAFMEQHPDAGALGVKMLTGNGIFLKESKRAFPDPVTSFYRLAGLSTLFPTSPVFSRYYLGNLPENVTQEVAVLSGAFMLVRKNVTDVIGLFDPAFFMYGEDIDLSYRIQQAGYKNYYLPSVQIIHFKGESTKKGSLNYIKVFYRAMSIFVNKHYGGNTKLFFRSLIHAGISVAGFCDGIKQLLRMKKKAADRNPVYSNRNTLAYGTPNEIAALKAFIARTKYKPRLYTSNCTGNSKRSDHPEEEGRVAHDPAQLSAPFIPSSSTPVEFSETIICFGESSLQEAISRLDQLPPGTGVRYFGLGSSSIISSESKDETGEILL